MDFMSHLVESMLCKAMSRSPGVRGDTEELPSPANTNTLFSHRAAEMTGCSVCVWVVPCCVPSKRLKTSFTTIGFSLISLGRAWMTSV